MRKREQEGYTEKELVNAHFESVKYKDLEWIKEQGGPFTKPEEVDEYMNSSHGEEIINKRLYVEVRYARNSCLSMKPTASVFRLKRNFQKLPSQEYAENMKEYLGDAKKKSNLTADDLSAILEDISNIGKDLQKSQNSDDIQSNLGMLCISYTFFTSIKD